MIDYLPIGFTGNRLGLTSNQTITMKLLARNFPNTTWRHGDCIGADAEFHDIVSEHAKNPYIIIHPPIISQARAFKTGYKIHKIMQPKPYLTRNQDIVNASSLLIAAPKHLIEETRSGTWSTIRYAKKKHVPVIILDP